MNPNYPNLLSPLQVGGTILKNRMICPPSEPHLAQAGENWPSDSLIAHYAQRAKGGAAIVTCDGNSFGTRPGGNGWDASSPDAQNYMSQMADAVHFYGAKAHGVIMMFAPPGMDPSANAPQIRMIQNNDNVMVEKIQTTLVNTIPLWKSQMVLALGIAHSTEAAEAQRQVTDITNALLKQNAEKLHMASVETAREAERGIVDIETLKATNAKLIQTFDDVMKIQADGRAKRLAAEAEMMKMENDLKVKLLEISSSR